MTYNVSMETLNPTIPYHTFPFDIYETLVSVLIGLVTLKLVRIIVRDMGKPRTDFSVSNFLGLFVLDLWTNTNQTHHVTLRPLT